MKISDLLRAVLRPGVGVEMINVAGHTHILRYPVGDHRGVAEVIQSWGLEPARTNYILNNLK